MLKKITNFLHERPNIHNHVQQESENERFEYICFVIEFSHVARGCRPIFSADADLILHALGGELSLATFHLNHLQIHVLEHLIQSEPCAQSTEKVLSLVKQTNMRYS
jgi:hypothetical protein